MAITEVYVDPSINADSGAGSSGDPYGDLEYAVEQVTFDTTNGTRFNIKAGATETLAANLYTATQDTSVSIAYVASETAALVFQGYTTTAGDGGIGVISGGGSVSIFDGSTFDRVAFVDMNLQNTGSAKIMHIDQHCKLIRCNIHNSTWTGGNVDLANNCVIMGCYFHNMTGNVACGSGYVAFNHFENETNDFGNAISVNGSTTIYRNIFNLDGSSNGIVVGVDGPIILNNSIFSNAGVGSGINIGSGDTPLVIANNAIEGFSDSGGFGIEFGANAHLPIYMNNAVYNCETNYDTPTYFMDDWSKGGAATNETLSASPFTAGATNDFTPVDTGSIKEGSLPDDFGNSAG